MMKRRVLFALLLALLCGSRAAAARIDTLSLDSRVLNRPVTVVAVLPDGASEHHPAPLLLLLHGYGGDAFSWLKIKTGLPALVDRTGIALLCPDGGQSWYMDSPVDTTSRYESFLVGELIPYADAHLPVARDARHRAVAGLSMGGLRRHAAGAAPPRPLRCGGEHERRARHPPLPRTVEARPAAGTAVRVARKLGADDPHQPHRAARPGPHAGAHHRLRLRRLHLRGQPRLPPRAAPAGHPPRLLRPPGGHELSYWANAIDYQMLFFSKFFAAADAEEERAFDGGSSAAASSSSDDAAAPAAASDARPEAQTGR